MSSSTNNSGSDTASVDPKKPRLEQHDFRYECDIDVAFPSSIYAEQVMQVMEVDQEIGDRVLKSFSLHCSDADDGNKEEKNVLRISFQATQAKLLRVVVSSFYDYLMVALKVYQEFDPNAQDDDKNNS